MYTTNRDIALQTALYAFMHSKKRVSFFQSVSAYWQVLLSALEGNATNSAASILLRISSRKALAVS
jgi:hypothetical protein